MSEKQTRREMLCSVGRYVALGGLALGAVQLVGGRKNASPDPCVRQFKCSRCGLVNDCLLPEAIVARQRKS